MQRAERRVKPVPVSNNRKQKAQFMKTNQIVPFIAVLLSCAIVGCGSRVASPIPINGTVKTKDGQPCNSALVVLHPQESKRLNDPKPVATTDGEGRFKLTTFAENDGATPGDYGVTIVWPGTGNKEAELSLSSEGASVGADQLNGNYGDPAKPLIKVTVSKTSPSELSLVVDQKMEVTTPVDPTLD